MTLTLTIWRPTSKKVSTAICLVNLKVFGAQLQKKTDGIAITNVILGGPVWKGKLLEVGDQILKVGQGAAEPVDVVGMRLDDAVKLIKGPKGTEVRLTVKRVDGTIEVVPIIRDVVEIEETYAKSAVITANGKRYGLINLPKFYIDFEDVNRRNAATDVALEIEKLKKRKYRWINYRLAFQWWWFSKNCSRYRRSIHS